MSDPHVYYRPETYRMEDMVGYLAKQLSVGMARELDRRMAELGLTDAQWRPMLLIQQGKVQTAAELARLSCHDSGAVTRLLDRLESKQLLRRERSSEDRRIVHLVLTEAGARVAAEVPRIITELSNEVLEGFSAEEFSQLKGLLQRALSNARKIEQEASHD